MDRPNAFTRKPKIGKTYNRKKAQDWNSAIYETKLALIFEVTPRLADNYRVKKKFLDVMRAKSSSDGK